MSALPRTGASSPTARQKTRQTPPDARSAALASECSAQSDATGAGSPVASEALAPLAPLAQLTSTIPVELLETPRWIVFELKWATVKGERKLKKTPHNARTGELASSTDANTWSTFGEAYHACERGAGVGRYVLGYALGDGVAGVDLDKCRAGAAGELTPDALAIVRLLDSYTEASPSGTGVHVLLRGALPDASRGRRRGPVEMYSDARFFTITGAALADTPRELRERTEALAALHARTFSTDARATAGADRGPTGGEGIGEPIEPASSTASSSPASGDADMSDSAVLARAMRASDGDKFARLWSGDTSGYPSASEADMGLVAKLRFYTRSDASQIDRLFRQSGRMRPKWDERHYADGASYGAKTIREALAGQYDVWTPRRLRIVASPDRGADHGPDRGEGIEPDGAASPSSEGASEGKRRICVNAGEPGAVCRAVIDELYAHHATTRIFQRSGQLAYLHDDGDGRLTIQDMGEDRLRALVEETMRCVAVKPGRDEDAPARVTNVLLPRDLARMILAASAWPFPTITGVSSVPIVRPDGSICSTPGYDPLTRRYYAPRADVRIPDVPEAPTRADAQRAAARLQRIFCDFPFANRATDTANALAFMLTPLLRAAINGPVPLAAVDATKAGSGKSKLMTLLVATATGALCGEVHVDLWPNADESEARKKLVSLLAGGADIIAFDNIKGVLNSSALEAMLTARAGADRLLGASQMVKFSNQATWIITGNGMRLGGDLYRRAYWIRLDAPMAHPELRREADFQIPHIHDYIDAHLGRILADLLTMIRAWYAASAPTASAQPVMGSFEAWVRIIAGVLDYAGVAGFLATLQDDMSLADEESTEWGAFFMAWHAQYADAPVRVNDVARFMEGSPDSLMVETLPNYLAREYGKLGKGFQVALGTALHSRTGRRYGEREVRVLRAGEDKHSHSNLWRVELNTEAASPSSSPDNAPYSPDTVTYGELADAEDGRELWTWSDTDADAAPYAPIEPDAPDDPPDGEALAPVGDAGGELLHPRQGETIRAPDGLPGGVYRFDAATGAMRRAAPTPSVTGGAQ